MFGERRQESGQQALAKEERPAANVDKVGVKFARKAFKWNQGHHKTDDALGASKFTS